jgi:hypothetical protein
MTTTIITFLFFFFSYLKNHCQPTLTSLDVPDQIYGAVQGYSAFLDAGGVPILSHRTSLLSPAVGPVLDCHACKALCLGLRT